MPTPITNNYYDNSNDGVIIEGDVTESYIVGQAEQVVQIGHMQTSPENAELASIIGQIRDHVVRLNLEPNIQAPAVGALAAVTSALATPEPNEGAVHGGLRYFYSIIEPVVGGLVAGIPRDALEFATGLLDLLSKVS